METHIDSFWIFALPTKYHDLSLPNLLLLLLLFATTWLLRALSRWAHPGGPAWGRHPHHSRNDSCSPIPGPRGLPVLGSMQLMHGLAHRRLATAASRHRARRLMAFSLGETRAVVASDPGVAREILNSSAFADRPMKESAYGLLFDRAIGFAPYGRYWRVLRRVAARHLFSPRELGAGAERRRAIAEQMVSAIVSHGRVSFQVREIASQASLNNMMGSVFGREYELLHENEETRELRGLVEEGYDLLGKLNWSDHLPWLAGLDLQRVRFRCSELVPRVNRFVGRIIQEHKCRTGPRSSDFVDVLLALQGHDKLSDPDMIAVLWEMIFRGTDTVAVLIEWILARMVLHPHIQSRVHEELDRVVGRSQPLMELDLQSTPYLSAVVKETLRLHPPGPLLSWARLAIVDTTLGGYQVPAGTTAMVNMWAITRDPEVWADPLEFTPERFMGRDDAGAEFSVFGSDARLAPFGSGRRVCPGKDLGLTTVTYLVGRLLQEFEWAQVDHSPVNLSEVLRLSCEMVNPLTVKVSPRRS
ncbi:cytochrome P450 78A9-like [Rhodamnia argentea]|uniref:Cytochrome P450 78A9-like n=1 Tax=Rhodamnia argentea TaxID=178133 RepID=A0A8B8P6N7_9MYRT|nr:cytochrome P450 78A9-like [Rhodamnia argentea]